jgi:hypothetical protein
MCTIAHVNFTLGAPKKVHLKKQLFLVVKMKTKTVAHQRLIMVRTVHLHTFILIIARLGENALLA